MDVLVEEGCFVLLLRPLQDNHGKYLYKIE